MNILSNFVSTKVGWKTRKFLIKLWLLFQSINRETKKNSFGLLNFRYKLARRGYWFGEFKQRTFELSRVRADHFYEHWNFRRGDEGESQQSFHASENMFFRMLAAEKLQDSHGQLSGHVIKDLDVIEINNIQSTKRKFWSIPNCNKNRGSGQVRSHYVCYGWI